MIRLYLFLLATLVIPASSSAIPLASLTLQRTSGFSDTGVTRLSLRTTGVQPPDLMWQFNDTQAFVGMPPTYSGGFDVLTSAVTDGLDSNLWALYWKQSNLHPLVFTSVDAAVDLESEWFGGANLTGATIDSIMLAWEPGVGTYGRATVTLNGTPVPELGSGVMLMSGLAGLAIQRRVMRRSEASC